MVKSHKKILKKIFLFFLVQKFLKKKNSLKKKSVKKKNRKNKLWLLFKKKLQEKRNSWQKNFYSWIVSIYFFLKKNIHKIKAIL